MRPIHTLLITLALSGWMGNAAAIPISTADIIKVDGTEWAQVDLFIGNTWSDMQAVCPGGVCLAGGMLNGYDMSGWQWATVNDVNALFNYYIGSSQLGPGPDGYQESFGSFADDFFSAGWRTTLVDTPLAGARLTEGSMSDTSAQTAYIGDIGDLRFPTAVTIFNAPPIPRYGGWFYRGTSPQVSAPATLALLGLGLVSLGWTRRMSA